MRSTGVMVVSAAVVAVLAMGIYSWLTTQGNPPSSATTSGSLSSSTTTTVTRTVTETTSVTATSETSTSISSSTVNGSFTYSPSSPLKVLSVRAVVFSEVNGDRYVEFEVQFHNGSNSTAFVIGGCGSGLEASLPANSSVIQTVKGGPICACAEFIMALNQGQNHTSTVPGCWSGYAVKLLSPGTVSVDLKQYWSVSAGGATNSNWTSIRAIFDFT